MAYLCLCIASSGKMESLFGVKRENSGQLACGPLRCWEPVPLLSPQLDREKSVSQSTFTCCVPAYLLQVGNINVGPPPPITKIIFMLMIIVFSQMETLSYGADKRRDHSS